MDFLLVIVLIISVVVAVVSTMVYFNSANMKKQVFQELQSMRRETVEAVQSNIATLSNIMVASHDKMAQIQDVRLSDVATKMERITRDNDDKLQKIQMTLTSQLDKIQNVVDEKLQKTLEDRITKSFQQVAERLEQVHKGLGEMQNLATGVGDLKKVLSNVKTRGILGEIQLGAILSEILSPGQYEENVAVRPNSRERVEFAIKMPGIGNGNVYLPIDAKFPGDAYGNLVDAYENGNKEEIEYAVKNLETAIKNAAKDISSKYIAPPHTTNFAIMFLPFEGLYAEVVRRNLVEELQRTYKINVAGPTTMAALLNSLQMGFKTLAIQKQSGEVWKILAETKQEFGKFEDIIGNIQQKIIKVNEEFDKLVGARTRKINKALKDIEEPKFDRIEQENFKDIVK